MKELTMPIEFWLTYLYVASVKGVQRRLLFHPGIWTVRFRAEKKTWNAESESFVNLTNQHTHSYTSILP
ncbi:hypothetical protein L2E82_20896 [Cichorium intybus]|uniref:Uncharacterized protein n=1 Tax=Cichorium intybus TaxID=13427 RepID=A0ACB9DU99_CICIN|nr:hypothetical protein L2E82_20896 [Cichorium intybus]